MRLSTGGTYNIPKEATNNPPPPKKTNQRRKLNGAET